MTDSTLAPLRIVYMGTPQFAVPSLAALAQAGHTIAAVVTVPDKPAGRGKQLQQSPVKQFALAQGWPVLQPERLKDPAFLAQLAACQADVFVVVAFRMLPREVWSMPRLGTFNLHGSLLPQYRGAAPINWAVMNGETETGLTTFFIDQEIDTGEMIYQARVPIPPDATATQLHDTMMDVGASLVVRTVAAIAAGNAPRQPQPYDGQLKPAPKIFTEHCAIPWQLLAAQVYNHIRGLAMYPGAWTLLDGKTIKVYGSRVHQADGSHGAPGSIIASKKQLLVACGTGVLELTSLKPEGRKEMTGTDLLNGYTIEVPVFGTGQNL